MRKKYIILVVVIVCVIAVVLGVNYSHRQAICGEWTLKVATDDNGNTILSNHDELNQYPGATESNMTFSAEKGIFILAENDQNWQGTYLYSKSNLAGTIYTVEIDKDGQTYQGLAVASNPFFAGKSNNILTVTVVYGSKNYSLFFEKQ